MSGAATTWLPGDDDEALVVAAATAARLAPTTCGDCAPYHGFWPTMRVLGLAASPARHEAFFRDALAPPAGARNDAVLIAGAADQGMAALVSRAYGARDRTPGLTVVDRCATPLALCRSWAASSGCALRTVQADLRAFTTAQPFDAVCTHSLLGTVAPEDRLPLFARLRDALRPGGRLVTVARIAPAGDAPAAGDAFVARVLAASAQARTVLGLDRETLAASAARYAAYTTVAPLRSLDELASLTTAAGFRVHALEQVAIAGADARSALAVPGSAAAGTYAELVAIR